MALSQSTETITLNGTEDWEPWSTQFKAKAVASELWDLINPEEEEPAPFEMKPAPPKVQDYDKRLVARDTRSQSSGATLGEEVDTTANPRNTSEMTKAAQTAFQLDWSMYTHQSKLYTEQKDAIEKLKNWVLKTTNTHLIRTACTPTDTIKKWYANLEEQVGVNDAKQRKDARERYKMAIKPLSKQPKDILVWLGAWEQAISLAKEKKVPEAQHSSEWFEDFAVVVKPWMDYWVTS